MSNKRSLPAVTKIVLFSLIIISILRIMFTGSIFPGFSFLSRNTLLLIILYSLLSNVGYIISSVAMLKFKKWSRMALVLLIIIQTSYMLIVSIPLVNKSLDAQQTSTEIDPRIEQAYYNLPEQVRIDKDLTLDNFKELIYKKLKSMALIINIISLLYLVISLVVLTRKSLSLALYQDNEEVINAT